MLNAVYQLTKPRNISVVYKDVNIDDSHVLVRPTHLSICNADQRYYQGTRGEAVLKKKLPMALIHEGVGQVVYDPTGTFPQGQRVIMIPNTPTEHDPIIAENYLRSSKFRASGYDGFMQEYVSMTPDRLVSLPDEINPLVAAFTELVSVSCHAISRFQGIAHPRREKIGVWGDGNLGFITALLLKKSMPESQIYVFGTHESKLADFAFADGVYTVSSIPENFLFDHAFECVGGAPSGTAINQIIDYIHPEGTISILGVSEEPVPINTRMVLEKGLRIFGSSRSGRLDFAQLVALYQQYPDIVDHLEKLIGAEVHVRTIADMHQAFESDIHKISGKTVMVWDI